MILLQSFQKFLSHMFVVVQNSKIIIIIINAESHHKGKNK